jgi:glutaconate CoA-transferase subunit A
MGYSTRDNDFYRRWDLLARDRDRFTDWVARYVHGTENHAEYLKLVAETVDA